MELEITGTDEAVDMFEDLAENATKISGVLDNAGQELTQRSRSMAISKGLYKTGAGVKGINWSRSGYESRVVGWAGRPNLHLLFHEIGTYKDPPRPHIRPAALQYEPIFVNNVKNTLFKI